MSEFASTCAGPSCTSRARRVRSSSRPCMICARSASTHGSAAPASSALVCVLISPNVALQRFVALAQVRGALHPLLSEWRSRLSCRALLNERFVKLAFSLAQRQTQARAVLPGALGEGAQPG